MRTMNEYRALKAISELQQKDRWAIGILSNLASLARARSYLVGSLQHRTSAVLTISTVYTESRDVLRSTSRSGIGH